MTDLRRLVTFVDVDDQVDDSTIQLHVRHEAELPDGSRLLLLCDRGWTISGPPDIWAYTSVDEIIETARVVVGPDEPFANWSPADMERHHWVALQKIAGQQGVTTDVAKLRSLPHDVVLSSRIIACVSDS